MLQLGSQLADALAKAHDAGVVHCDLKPENVMLTADGHVKVVDFGLARLAEPARAHLPIGRRRSDAGVLFGTVGYMSPEQARGESADYRADQSRSARSSTSWPPARVRFTDTSVETLSMIIGGTRRRLDVKPSLPLPLIWTIERCLSKNPADRYASTRDLAREVQTLRDHSGRLVRARRAASRDATARVVLAAAVAGAARWPQPPCTCRSSGAVRQASRARRRSHSSRSDAASSERALRARWPDGPLCRGWGGAPSPGVRNASLRTRVASDWAQRRRALPVSPRTASRADSGCRLDWANCVGMLARMPPGGGAPREVLEDVVSADWTPDGQALAAIQVTEGEYQLQFPIGKSLYRRQKLGWLGFSPRGDRLAFAEFPLLSDEAGSLKIVDSKARVTTLSSVGGQFEVSIGRLRRRNLGVGQRSRGRGSLYTVRSTVRTAAVSCARRMSCCWTFSTIAARWWRRPAAHPHGLVGRG